MRYVGAKNGKVGIYEKNIPEVKPNYVLVKTKYSSISPGTELTGIRKSDNTIHQLGYSASGVIVDIGENVDNLAVGDAVACYGGPYVYHSEYLLLPKTMVTSVSKNVSLKEASLGGIGAISIHALRKANLQFGEVIIVVGLGIYGNLISQIALNAGYQVLAINRSKPRAELFEKIVGIKAYTDEAELENTLSKITNGRGADAVFLCAGGDDGHLCNKSLEWLRDKGKSVIVGDLRANYERPLMFKKEIDVMISRAGGPGRYDTSFEKDAVDYPYGFVRWTETRNVGEFIRLLSTKKISVSDYFSCTCNFDDVVSVYERLLNHGSEGLTEVFKYNN